MSDIEKFHEFNDIVISFYATLPLIDLDDVKVDGHHSMSFYSGIVRKKQALRPFEKDFKLYDDLLFISRDVKYQTALLYFFRPYIVNSAVNGTYYQTVEDRRYMTFASTCIQSIYNFWDRIGDLLNIFFNTGLNGNVYLARVLHNFPNQYKTSANYIWLNDKYNNEIKAFLGQRDDIVHSYQLECEYYWKIMDASMNLDIVRPIQMEKNSFPEKFKAQIELMMEAFVVALKLIEECPDKVFPLPIIKL